MDMHHIAQLFNGCITAHENADLLNDVGSVGTIGVTAENATFLI